MVDHCAMRHDTDIDAWERRRSLMHQWYAGTFSPAELFYMVFPSLVDEAVYILRLYAVFWKYRDEGIEENGVNWLSVALLFRATLR